MTLDAFSLDGRRAFVTGSESGLGRAIAAAFVEAGADVVGADISVDTGRVGYAFSGRARAAPARSV